MDSLFHVLVSTCLALTFSGKCLSPLPLRRVALSAAEQSPPEQMRTNKTESLLCLASYKRNGGQGQCNSFCLDFFPKENKLSPSMLEIPLLSFGEDLLVDNPGTELWDKLFKGEIPIF